MSKMYKQIANELPFDADPDMVKSVFDYLFKLQDSGTTNMYVAVQYIERQFWVDKHVARTLFASWVDNFDELINLK